MQDDEMLADLDSALEDLEQGFGGASAMAARFDQELRRVQNAFGRTALDVAALDRGLSRGLRHAFDDLALGSGSLAEALKAVSRSMLDSVYSAAVRPVTDHLGSTLAQGIGSLVNGMFPMGGGFGQKQVQAFAKGGVVQGPTSFAMRGGYGLMGEAGPEAIMPLSRGADGRLGVRAQAASPISVVMNIQTPDVEGFKRSQSQIAGQMSRMLGKAQRFR